MAKYTTIFYWMGHYILYILSHAFALNYLLVYILFKDAQENSAYMIDDVRDWEELNIIIACVMLYCIVNLQAIYLSCRHSRHILPCVVCSMFYGLSYLALGLANMKGCIDRTMLSCSQDTQLSNRIIDASVVYICWGLAALTLWVLLWVISLVGFNFRRVYYWTENTIGEIIMVFVSYYTIGAVILMPPLWCLCGDEDSSIDLGNAINGIEIV